MKSIKSEFEEEACFVKGARGAANLLDKQGYAYHKHKISSDSSKIHWICPYRRKNQCKGRATTEGFKIIKLSEHNHPPDGIVHEEV